MHERTRFTPLAAAVSATLFLLLTAVASLDARQPDEPANDLSSYRSAAERIIRAARAGNDSHTKLEELCLDVGHRLSGSKALDEAVEWAVRALRADGQDNVRAEHVMVPRWVRGRESAELIEPRRAPLAMLGLGGSVATPADGITAEVVVVGDERQLDALGDAVRDKIVLFNNPMPPYDTIRGSSYGETVRFRHGGARLAADKGAVACLIRSVTARSLRSAHTGAMSYGNGNRRIPAAALSIEDAEMIARLAARGKRVVVNLRMEARDEGMVSSANVVAELRGREKPDEIVVIGGHLDSWDVGHGAHDDGAGCVMSMEAVNILRKLRLIPRRTIRVVLFTNEENGLNGAKQYVEDHAHEMGRHVAAIEADSGGFRPTGFSFECEDRTKAAAGERQLRAIAQLMSELGPMRIRSGGSGADVGRMRSKGVFLMGLEVDGSTYFDYHHSHGDTLDKVDPRELTDATAAMAVMAYVIADMPERLGER
ncbi:MAG: M20/M25/M40 family metallo-hydrolase [Phycisphaerae bacterium]|nr:M20/M25/M40 family metallo-hydrolase [Phycisphaerae bacterium]